MIQWPAVGIAPSTHMLKVERHPPIPLLPLDAEISREPVGMVMPNL